MTDGPDRDAAGNLRRQAEDLWRQQAERAGRNLPTDPLALLHELEVHQIELELQNAELRRAQEELAVVHARYFDLFDLAPVGYLTIDGQGLIREANLAAAGLLAVERAALPGQPLTRFIWHDDQDVYYLHRKRLAEGRGVDTCELRLRGKAAEPHWVRLQSTQAEGGGGAPHTRITVSDISDRKRAEDQIRFEASLLQMVEEAVIVTDLDLAVIYWNRFAEVLYGWPVEEALGHLLPELILPQGSAKPVRAFETGSQAKRSWVGVVDVKAKNGKLFPAYFTISPIKDPAGNPVGAIAVSRDSSASRRQTDKLTLDRAQLRGLARRLVEVQESERKSISDQLFNDESQRLAVLVLQLGRLGRETENPATHAEISALQVLVSDVMSDLHGLAASLRPATLDRLGLEGALVQYAEDFGPQHKLQVDCLCRGFESRHIAPDVETAIYRIVQHALNNVAVHARAKHVTVLVQARDSLISATIEDDGVGFEAQAAPELGQPGLLEMRERTEMLGGHLRVESASGRGTTIYAAIPITGSVSGNTPARS